MLSIRYCLPYFEIAIGMKCGPLFTKPAYTKTMEFILMLFLITRALFSKSNWHLELKKLKEWRIYHVAWQLGHANPQVKEYASFINVLILLSSVWVLRKHGHNISSMLITKFFTGSFWQECISLRTLNLATSLHSFDYTVT